MRRIIGQCHNADFKDLLYIGDHLKQGEEAARKEELQPKMFDFK